jgi:hypothetical protein
VTAQGNAAEIAGQTDPGIAGAVYRIIARPAANVGQDAPLELVGGLQAVAQGFLASDADIAGAAADAIAALDARELLVTRLTVDVTEVEATIQGDIACAARARRLCMSRARNQTGNCQCDYGDGFLLHGKSTPDSMKSDEIRRRKVFFHMQKNSTLSEWGGEEEPGELSLSALHAAFPARCNSATEVVPESRRTLHQTYTAWFFLSLLYTTSPSREIHNLVVRHTDHQLNCKGSF